VWWIARIRRRLRHLPQLRRLLSNSGKLFRHRRSSLAEGEHTIVFVSSIPFHFAIQSTVSWSFPSNPICLLFLCMYRWSRPPWPTAAAPFEVQPLPFSSATGEHLPTIPRSPLSVPQSTQAPSHPKPQQLDVPGVLVPLGLIPEPN
jgi:hypothetical protein